MAEAAVENAMVLDLGKISRYKGEDKHLFGLDWLDVVPGVRLSILDTKLVNGIKTHDERDADVIEFSYVLSGHARVQVRSGCSVTSTDIRPGEAISFYSPDSRVTFSVPGNQSLKMLGVILDTSYLESMLDGDKSCILESVLASSERMLNRRNIMSSMQKMVVSQMLSCALPRACQRLYMQSKALELIALHFASLSEPRVGQSVYSSVSLNSEDLDRIRLARETLKRNMTEPPSLVELSGMCNLNVNKLKKGFRAVYGKTAYGCLHEDRMKHAQTLLQERRLNVSEVAWKVGYINVSHFSGAFQKFFGIRPKQYQLQIGRHLHYTP